MSLSSPSLTHWSQLAHRLAGEVARLCARGAASRRFELHRLLRALEGEPGPPRTRRLQPLPAAALSPTEKALFRRRLQALEARPDPAPTMGRLQAERDALHWQLHRSRHLLARHVAPEIARLLSPARDSPMLREQSGVATLLQVDLRGFTQLGEQLPAGQLMALVNRYLGTLVEVVQAWGGSVNELLGDAVLATFGLPRRDRGDADRALGCGLAMQRALRRLHHRHQRLGLPSVAAGVALHTGPVVAGRVGSELRAKYALVGPPLNQLARIEEACPPGLVLASAATLEAALQRPCIGGRALLPMARQQAVEVFEIVACPPV